MHAKRKLTSALALLAGLYVSGPALGNPGDPVCSASKTLAAAMAPLAKGEVAGVQVQENPKAVPNLSFKAADGTEKTLADLKGKTVLLNLWATWCAPCRQEMPALDQLQAKLGSKDFEVVAVNIDTRNPDKPKQFLADMKIANLAFYADPSARIYQDLKAIGKAFGMPTTMIIDKEGCEVGYLAGPAEWSSADGLALVGAAIAK